MKWFLFATAAGLFSCHAWAENETRMWGDAEYFADPKLGPFMRSAASANDFNRCVIEIKEAVAQSEKQPTVDDNIILLYQAAETVVMWLKLGVTPASDRKVWPEPLIESYLELSRLVAGYGEHIPQKWTQDLTVQMVLNGLGPVDPKVTRTFVTEVARKLKPVTI